MSTTAQTESRFEFQRRDTKQSADSNLQESTEEAAVCSPLRRAQQAEPLDPQDNYRSSAKIGERPLLASSELHRVKDCYRTEDGYSAKTLNQAGKALAGAMRWEEGLSNSRRGRARRAYGRLLNSDRLLREEYDDPHTALVSLRLSPTRNGRAMPLVLLAESLIEHFREAQKRMRYHLDKREDWECARVISGTDRWGTPHLHVLYWIDGAVEPDDFSPLVSHFVENCPLAPSSGRGNRIEEGAVTVRGPEQPLAKDDVNEHYTETRGSCTQGAHYVANQIPFLTHPDRATDATLWFYAGVDASRVNAVSFSQGCWKEGDRVPAVETTIGRAQNSKSLTETNCNMNLKKHGLDRWSIFLSSLLIILFLSVLGTLYSNYYGLISDGRTRIYLTALGIIATTLLVLAYVQTLRQSVKEQHMARERPIYSDFINNLINPTINQLQTNSKEHENANVPWKKHKHISYLENEKVLYTATIDTAAKDRLRDEFWPLYSKMEEHDEKLMKIDEKYEEIRAKLEEPIGTYIEKMEIEVKPNPSTTGYTEYYHPDVVIQTLVTDDRPVRGGNNEPWMAHLDRFEEIRDHTLDGEKDKLNELNEEYLELTTELRGMLTSKRDDLKKEYAIYGSA